MSQAFTGTSENSAQLSPSTIQVYRTVVGFMLLALIWKWPGFLTFFQIYKLIELNDNFFPAWLQHPWMLALTYLTTVGCCIGCFFTRRQRTLQVQSILATLSLCVLCVHQGSYNDVTFYTAAWTSLWTAWFVHRCRIDSSELVIEKGSFLANIILAMILLGGAVGKWTPEYWSGQVLYEIYFVDRDFWIFNLLRSIFDQDALAGIAKWYSRLVISTETLCCIALVGLPRHISASMAFIVFISIAMFSNFYLFSVVFSTIGLATVSIYRYQLFPTQTVCYPTRRGPAVARIQATA